MVFSILVATPYTAFGELLRISLENNNQFCVKLVASGTEAILAARKESYLLAILDSAISDIPFSELFFLFRNQQKNTRIIIIPPENNPNHLTLSGLSPDGFVTRPFYLPDLYETILNILTSSPKAASSNETEHSAIPEWLQDQESIAVFLEDEIRSLQANSAVVVNTKTTKIDEALLAYTSQIDKNEAHDVAELVMRLWKQNDSNELLNYFRSTNNNHDYLAYMTRIKDGLVIIILFENSAALSSIRPKTKRLAYRLATNLPILHNQTAEKNLNGDLPVKQTDELISIEELFPSGDKQIIESKLDNQENLITGHEPFPFLSEILGEIPNPNPGQDSTQAIDDRNDLKSTIPPSSEDHELVADDTASTIKSIANQGVIAQDSLLYIENDSHIAETKASPATVAHAKTIEPHNDPLEDTRPHTIASITRLNQLEPVSPSLCKLNYTCVLIPRLSQNYLSGKLAEFLAQWINQICLAYGWRLTAISIRPDFLLWTVEVNPSISPGNIVRIIRQRCSLYIFNEFPQLREQNPSGDFWAAGYLIVSGAQPPSGQLIREYILQTRRRQGSAI